ncbi:Dinitrogenase iron-molybdenum cofactor biosynthesis protein [Denitrovibrio acetiphilus DSM 12809]|uniref:Dinitrogenase iron-molybdenum cofactor biosynthesis protein n=1 Tax=Denitrovibrio acetiphilus (strain DSM 12809 / NBRC 114555 / N2460) TaxID=522772 RepID=D4H808_DENA2|nr:NifB/NifX family molybdenum-iron cluster-binding protein [Denitrovibrio acetiphilus]ADD68157.1 Dinitrogenase iron-molybdenum cofactor biosynthesis protein [Denitrovibrio acetiphilus DSM 12809]
MRLAFSITGQDLDSDIDPRFGRAKRILIYDTQNEKSVVMDNDDNVNAAQGAGISLAQKLCEKEVNAVITGNCGPKALDALTKAGIEVFSTKIQKASLALTAHTNGLLERVGEA